MRKILDGQNQIFEPSLRCLDLNTKADKDIISFGITDQDGQYRHFNPPADRNFLDGQNIYNTSYSSVSYYVTPDNVVSKL